MSDGTLGGEDAAARADRRAAGRLLLRMTRRSGM